MNRKEIEQEEQYYKRFNQKETVPQDREEIQAFSLYAQIRSHLRSGKVPGYHQQELINRMVTKMGEKQEKFWFFHIGLNRLPLYKVAAITGLFVICVFICSQFVLPINWDLTQKISFFDAQNHEIALPISWKYLLWSGKQITIPSENHATLYLSDGSKVYCQGGTQISIQFNANRKIFLNSGKVLVSAASNVNRPMFVKTPVGEVKVTGTVFTVELTQ